MFIKRQYLILLIAFAMLQAGLNVVLAVSLNRLLAAQRAAAVGSAGIDQLFLPGEGGPDAASAPVSAKVDIAAYLEHTPAPAWTYELTAEEREAWPHDTLAELRQALQEKQIACNGEAAFTAHGKQFTAVCASPVFLTCDSWDKPKDTASYSWKIGYASYLQIFDAEGRQTGCAGTFDRAGAPRMVRLAEGVEWLLISEFIGGGYLFEIRPDGTPQLMVQSASNNAQVADLPPFDIRDSDGDGVAEVAFPADADWGAICEQSGKLGWYADSAGAARAKLGAAFPPHSGMGSPEGRIVLAFPQLLAEENRLQCRPAWWSSDLWGPAQGNEKADAGEDELATQRAVNSAEYERIQSRPITTAEMAKVRETGEEGVETQSSSVA